MNTKETLRKYYLVGIDEKDEVVKLFKTDKICCIDGLYVHSGYKGGGIGRILLNKLLDKMTQKGINEFFLEAIPSELSSDSTMSLNELVEFYRKFGFEEILRTNNSVLMFLKK